MSDSKSPPPKTDAEILDAIFHRVFSTQEVLFRVEDETGGDSIKWRHEFIELCDSILDWQWQRGS